MTEDQYFHDSQFYLAVSAKMGLDDVIRKVIEFRREISRDVPAHD